MIARKPTSFGVGESALELVDNGSSAEICLTDPEVVGETGSLLACPEVRDADRVPPSPSQNATRESPF